MTGKTLALAPVWGEPTLFLTPPLRAWGSSEDGSTVGGAMAPSASPSSAGWLAGRLGMPLPIHHISGLVS